jgi:zinc transporter ZupT
VLCHCNISTCGCQVVGASALKIPLLAFSAGGFLYIALVDLLPELRTRTSLRDSITQSTFIILGIGLMWGLRLVFHH